MSFLSSKKSSKVSFTKDNAVCVTNSQTCTTKDKIVSTNSQMSTKKDKTLFLTKDNGVSSTSCQIYTTKDRVVSAKKDKRSVDSVSKVKCIFKEPSKSRKKTPDPPKCNNCAQFTQFTRKIIGNILNITKHLALQDTSRVVQTFLNLPNFLNTETQIEMTAHWLNDIQHDMDFLEMYAMKRAKTSGKIERERLKTLERMYKMKMREVWQTVRGFQDLLTRISPSLLLNFKTQTDHEELIVEILNKSVASLKSNIHHCEQLILVKYKPKINSLRKQLENVTNIVTNTMKSLTKLEETYDAMKLSYEEYKNKYQLQIQIQEQLCLENDILQKDIKSLKKEIKNDTGNEDSHRKSLEELKQQNENITNSINRLNVKLKSALHLNFKLTKQLNEEKQMKQSLIQLKETLNQEIEEERKKVKTLTDINAAFKNKLTKKTNIKEELARRFDCDISDTENENRNELSSTTEQTKKQSLERNEEICHQTKDPANSICQSSNPLKKTLESLNLSRKVTGNPCDDIKAEIISNYKLIKQVEEEILTLNKLRMKIKEKNKSDMRPD